MKFGFSNVGILQHLLFVLVPVYASVKIQSFRAKERKIISCAKSFKIV